MLVLAAVRIQAFVTRAYTAGITGLSTGSPDVCPGLAGRGRWLEE
jgi:hypothetical protein